MLPEALNPRDTYPEFLACLAPRYTALKVLEEAELIVARRDGRERWNHLNALPIKQIHDRWISQYAGHALSIIDRLKSDLEA